MPPETTQRTQNAERITREQRTVPGNFDRKQSLRSRTQQRFWGRGTNDNAPTPADDNGVLRDRTLAGAPRIPSRRVQGPDETARSHTRTGVQQKAARALSPIMYTVAWFCSFWIGLFGLLGVALIATGHSEVLWGLFTVDSIVPATSAGMGFWGLSIVFTLGGYALIGIMLAQQGISALGSIGLIFLTFLCVALDIAPILQIIPWMVVWIFFLQTTALVQTTRH